MSTINSTSSNRIPMVIGPGEGASVEQRYAATEAQLEVWLSSQQSIEANCAYNEISSLALRGKLDRSVLEKAITEVVLRNSSLRTVFSADGQEAIVRSQANHQFSFVDLTVESVTDVDHAQLEIVQRQACMPFDLENGPLLRCVLQKVAEDQHCLTVTAHHIVLDGWSLSILCRDLGYFYDKMCGVVREDLPPADSYADYSTRLDAYMESEDGKADEKFWVEQFADQIPVLDLPIERSRPALRTYYGRRYDHQFSAELVESIRKIGAKSGCSLFNVMLAAFNAYVSRISGCEDFCVGIPTAGQAAADMPNLIGHCVNTMPLRTQVDAESSFVDYMKASRTTLLNAFDHQQYSYGTLLRKLAPPRDPSRPPMLSVSFNVDPVIDTSEMGFEGLDVQVKIEPRSFENFEWFINGVIQNDKSVEMQVQYNADLYSTQSMKFYFEGFETFLNAIIDNPISKIVDLPLMSVSQRQQVIVDWNSTEMTYPLEATLGSEFARQAKETPNKAAVVFGDQVMTYAEVDTESNRIARYLLSQGVRAGDLVGICVNRSEKMLVYLYAILKAGAGYVPLDPKYPEDRLQYMCDHSGLKLIVTQSELAGEVKQFGKPLLAVDSASEAISKLDASDIKVASKPDDICYVIYTSGSTGKPKGVQVPHGAVVNFLYSMKQKPGFGPDDSVLAVTTLSFDIAVLELYLPTIFGGKVVIVDSETAADGVLLGELLNGHNISLLQATPATWRLMIGAGWNGKQDLKVLCGGEPMPQDLVGPLLQRCGELWNMYGPTETTVWSAVFRITDANAPIQIGKPIGNTQIYILDANGNEVPAGCEGEVFIGGAGVTLGYRNRQDLTDERFIEHRYRNPFREYVSDKIYKTGDLAKFCFDGNIHFLRRNDKQVKVRGFRIELGEIENNLKAHPAVEHNVVIVREDTPGDARLVGYVIFKPNQVATAGELKDYLRESLPYYMIPQHFVVLDAMPQTNNGKIDYKSLPVPSSDANAEASDIVPPKTPAEKFLAGVWQEVLEFDEISLNDNFFDIGGHSLLVMKVILAVKEKTGFKLGPQDFLVGTLEQLADKFANSDAFDNESQEQESVNDKEMESVESPSNTQKKEETSAKAKRSGFVRKLKGFWE